SVETVIQDYANVVERYPGTFAAKEAAERKQALDAMLRDIKADKKLEMADLAEIAQYRKAVDGFQPRRPDLTPIDAAITAYADLAKSEDAKGTVAAQEAAARASFIRRWKTTLEQRRDDYEQVESKADSLIKQKRFKDAARLWSDFREDTKKLETECPFAKDRYRTLLYDAAIAAGLKKCADEARAAWPLQEQEARGVAREGGYESAIKLLDGVIETTVDETLAAAKHLRDQLETEWASVTRRLEEDKAAATAAALAKARIAFAQ